MFYTLDGSTPTYDSTLYASAGIREAGELLTVPEGAMMTIAAALGVILGAGLEAHLRRGLMLTEHSFLQFFTRPITAAIMSVGIALLLYGSYSTWKISRKERAEAAAAEDDQPSDAGSGAGPSRAAGSESSGSTDDRD